MGTVRSLAAIFSAVIMVIAAPLSLVAYFGDHNEQWATRLAFLALVAGVIFLAAFFL